MPNRSSHLAKKAWNLAKGLGSRLRDSLDPLSKMATIGAVVIAGIWTYHLHQITGEEEINPEIWVSAQTFSYSNDARFLLVRIRRKNVGKVPIDLDAHALSLMR
jgi:hypothetical protein